MALREGTHCCIMFLGPPGSSQYDLILTDLNLQSLKLVYQWKHKHLTLQDNFPKSSFLIDWRILSLEIQHFFFLESQRHNSSSDLKYLAKWASFSSYSSSSKDFEKYSLSFSLKHLPFTFQDKHPKNLVRALPFMSH